MKVKVTKKAFYAGSLVSPGTVITIPDQTKGSWFEVIDEPKQPSAVNKQSVKKQESA